MQLAVAGQSVRGVDAALAMPVGELAARFFQYRDERGDVPSVNTMIEHQFRRPLRDHDEAEKVAEATLTIGRVMQSLERFRLLRLAKILRTGIAKHRIGQRRFAGNMNLFVVAIGSIATQGTITVAQDGDVTEPGNRIIVKLQADERGPEGNAADKAAGAVDGVDDPAVAGGSGLIGMFLAEETVVGKVPGNDAADFRLGVAVGDGDRAFVGLPFNIERRIINFAGQVAGGVGGELADFVAVLPITIHEDDSVAKVSVGGC